MSDDDTCLFCKGQKSIRNPTGKCDHLYFPENLTEEARVANGYVKATVEVWVKPKSVYPPYYDDF
jgi:hypothetical protein